MGERASIGFDSEGAEHVIPEGDDPALHEVSDTCGCNPDFHSNDEGYGRLPGEPVREYAIHHRLAD